MADTIDLTKKIEMIKNQPCFSRLTDEETDMLATLFIEKHISKDEVIVTKGDPVDSVFLIDKGTADVRNVFIKDNKLQSESLAQLGPGNAIGLNETGFYSISGIRTATVIALTDMTVLRLSVAAFNGFALAYPHVNEVMRRMSAGSLET